MKTQGREPMRRMKEMMRMRMVTRMWRRGRGGWKKMKMSRRQRKRMWRRMWMKTRRLREDEHSEEDEDIN